MKIFLLFSAIWCSVALAQFQDANFNGQTNSHSVVTTHYDSYYGGGACGENPASSDTELVAIPWDDKASPFDFAFCGTCYEFTGPSGKRVVKIFDWQESSIDTRWVINGYKNGPYPSIGCSGGECNVKIKLVPCPVSGNIFLDFNEWNNGYYILVTPRNQKVAVYKVTLTDERTGNTPIVLEHTQAAYVLGNRQVKVPFTLNLYSVTGEVVSVVVTGVPSSGSWPSNNLGSTHSYPTSVQFSQDYVSNPATTSKPTTKAPTTTTTTSKPTTKAPTSIPSTSKFGTSTKSSSNPSSLHSDTSNPVSSTETSSSEEVTTQPPKFTSTAPDSNVTRVILTISEHLEEAKCIVLLEALEEFVLGNLYNNDTRRFVFDSVKYSQSKRTELTNIQFHINESEETQVSSVDLIQSIQQAVKEQPEQLKEQGLHSPQLEVVTVNYSAESPTVTSRNGLVSIGNSISTSLVFLILVFSLF
eukprot:TRINITY_DN6668_c0_g1_i1.p1 TRINITY_DN6668_c0_g1~~TRINITY_DN6668_c0_g1_i1.p1  ORF type:complete len:484 (+),score=112.90 TRINITY_DN6668_c0_g1_i1:40-1452(+)